MSEKKDQGATVHLDRAVYRELQKAALMKHLSVQEMLRECVVEHLGLNQVNYAVKKVPKAKPVVPSGIEDIVALMQQKATKRPQRRSGS